MSTDTLRAAAGDDLASIVEEGPATKEDFARSCAWCGAFASEEDRRRFEEEDAQITHGICDECRPRIFGTAAIAWSERTGLPIAEFEDLPREERDRLAEEYAR